MEMDNANAMPSLTYLFHEIESVPVSNVHRISRQNIVIGNWKKTKLMHVSRRKFTELTSLVKISYEN